MRKLAGILNADEEELLALVGKVPAGPRDRAQTDLQFARHDRPKPVCWDEEHCGEHLCLTLDRILRAVPAPDPLPVKQA